MPYITRRDDSSVWQFRLRVPQSALKRVKGRHEIILIPDFRGVAGFTVPITIGAEVKFSLRTRDFEAATHYSAIAVAHLQKVFAAGSRPPSKLSHKDLVALSGTVYRLYSEAYEDNPGSPHDWAAFKALNRAALEGRVIDVPSILAGEKPDPIIATELFGTDLTAGVNALPISEQATTLEARFGEITNWVLTFHDIDVDAETRQALLRQVAAAAQDAGWRLKRNANGDYSPDPAAGRFPPFEKASSITLTDLFGRWQREADPAASTVVTWRKAVKSLQSHLGHENTRQISASNVIAWKDELVRSNLSTKTINDTYLAGIKAIFGYGVRNKLLTTNPAEGVKAQGRSRAGTQMLPYSDDEVARLLVIARSQTNPFRRWLPWLQALSGARVGELAQLWGHRITKIDGVYVMELRPAEDGGSFKNQGSERVVPLHPVLIQEGFLEFVKARGNGPLFYRRGSAQSNMHASKGVSNHLAEWIRKQGFNNPRKAPNHAFRHWWKSAAARAKVADSVADFVQGHSARSVAATYRHFDLKLLAQAISSIADPTVQAMHSEHSEIVQSSSNATDTVDRVDFA